jgi:uncharacterized protein
MITQREISKLAYQEKMSDRVIEKDYVLTWLLLAFADPPLRDILAFKGGTALKKIYFPDYRYSEDLDFTVVRATDAVALLGVLAETLADLARSQGFQFDLPEERIEKRTDSLTAYVTFVGPLQARLGSRDVKVDFTLNERLLYPIEAKKIHSTYGDAIERKIPTYSLEEILVEKLCAIIGRTEPRDIYDAHFLFEAGDIDFGSIPAAFREKATSKGIDPTRLKDVLARRQPTLAKMWETRLKQQVRDLPHLEQVLRELNQKLRQYRLV